MDAEAPHNEYRPVLTAPLNPRQQRFVEEFLVDLNATQAAVRAGYSKRGAEVQGHRLLTNANIAAALAEERAKVTTRTEVTVDLVLAGLLADARDRGESSSHQARVRAWELLGRHVGCRFTDSKLHIGGDPNAPPVKVNHGIEDEKAFFDRINYFTDVFERAAARELSGETPKDAATQE